MAKKPMKKYSSLLAIKEMQIKTTLRFHLTSVRIATIKNTNNNRRWQGYKKKEISHSVNKYNHYGKQYRGSPNYFLSDVDIVFRKARHFPVVYRTSLSILAYKLFPPAWG
jgi:hypothetical protein